MESKKKLLEKNIKISDRLIFALDVSNLSLARDLVLKLGSSVSFYKIGLELFLSGDFFRILDFLKKLKKKIFVDLKMFDIPETVYRSVKQLTFHDIQFTTVHGNDEILSAAVEAVNDSRSSIGILSVTALTSLNQLDIIELGFNCNIKDLVLSRAKRSMEIGCHGIITSGMELLELRSLNCENFFIVVPGVSSIDNISNNNYDQKRFINVEDSFKNGADYIVVGRLISRSSNPLLTAISIQEKINKIFKEQNYV